LYLFEIVKLEHNPYTPLLIEFTLLGILIFIIDEQSLNVKSPEVTLLGIVIIVNDKQYENV
jgi:hypothetical protein